jgi:hypothetical protein
MLLFYYRMRRSISNKPVFDQIDIIAIMTAIDGVKYLKHNFQYTCNSLSSINLMSFSILFSPMD